MSTGGGGGPAEAGPVAAENRIWVGELGLHVVVDGDGPPVLLVHGFPDDHTIWREQIPALVEAGYRVIAPDTRGCGLSDMPAEERAYRLDRLVADLAGLLDALGIEKVRLVAHDWGAVIGWHFCLAHPDRVERYAALSVGHPAAYARASLRQKLKGYYVLVFQLRGIAEWLIRRGNWWALRRAVGMPAEAAALIARLSRPGRLTAGINYYRANLGLLLAPPRPVEVPVMGVWSSRDRFLSEDQMTSSARYMSAPWRCERIEGVGHWLQIEAPDQVNALLLDYLRSP